LSRSSRAEQARAQAEALRRFMREELYPFSAYYRRVFDQAGVRPRDIRTVDDLRRLPFTTKQDLLGAQSSSANKRDFVLIPTPRAIQSSRAQLAPRDGPDPTAAPAALAAASSRFLLIQRAIEHSGAQARAQARWLARVVVRASYTPNFITFTTGRSADPVVFAYTPYDIDLLAESGARMQDVHAIHDVDARILNMFPFAPHLAFWQAAWGGFRTGRLMLSSGGGKVMGSSGNIKMVERLQPTVLIGTPGFVYHLLREMRERKTDLSAMKLIILGAEKVTPGLKRKMAESLEVCGARDVVISGTYGFTEARMAFSECPAGYDDAPGYHVYPDLGVFEVVDPKTLEPVGEGVTGELVYTPIAGHGTVVCRYRTGDVAVGGITWEPCRWCGRTVPRISSELTRSSDQRALNLTKIKGTLVDLANIGALLSSLPEIEEWQVVLRKVNDDPHDLDELVLRVSLRNGTDSAAFDKRIRAQMIEAVEIAPNRVELHTTDEMNAFTGMESEMKEKRFIDLRPK
jgi:phenylacetate-coenzyme A ligase PaaK-like adenylate-forming protein